MSAHSSSTGEARLNVQRALYMLSVPAGTENRKPVGGVYAPNQPINVLCQTGKKKVKTPERRVQR